MNNLGLKTVLGFAQLVAMMGIALFLPAGTFQFWQAWLFLTIFILSSALITVYLWKKDPRLLERRVKGGPAAEKENTQRWIQGVASIAFLAILIIPSFDHRFRWSQVPIPIIIAGDMLVGLGFLLVFLVFRENTYTSATIEVAENQNVVATGPYSIVRHPMYSGGLILLLGTPLALGSWYGLWLFVLLAIVIIARLLDEEKFLTENLSGYTEYCSKVHDRLIPLIW